MASLRGLQSTTSTGSSVSSTGTNTNSATSESTGTTGSTTTTSPSSSSTSVTTKKETTSSGEVVTTTTTTTTTVKRSSATSTSATSNAANSSSSTTSGTSASNTATSSGTSASNTETNSGTTSSTAENANSASSTTTSSANTANSSGTSTTGNSGTTTTTGNSGTTTTTITTTAGENGSAPVTTITTDDGTKTSTTSTSTDATTGITTVTTSTSADTNTNAASSTTTTINASGSSTTATSEGASSATGSSTTTTTTEATTEGSSASTANTNTGTTTTSETATTSTAGSATSGDASATTVSGTSGGSTATGTSTTSTTTISSTGDSSNTATASSGTGASSTTTSSTTTTGSTTGDANSATTTSSGVGASSTTTSTTTTTGSTTGSTNNGASTTTTAASSGTGARSTTTSTTSTTGSTTGDSNSATTTTSSGVGATSTTTSTTTTGSGNAATTSSGAGTSTTSSTTNTASSAAGASSSASTTTTGGTASTGSTTSSTTSVSSTGSTTGSTTGSSTTTEGSSVSSTSSSKGSAPSAALSSSSSGDSSSSSTTTSSSSSSSSNSASLESWFTSNFHDEETQLVVGAKSAITSAGTAHQVCGGEPALVTRSNTETANGGCPDELTALNASCTCLTGYSESATSWAFHVTTEYSNSTTTTTQRPLTQSSSDELVINTIRPIWVPSSLQTLTIEGADDSPAAIAFIGENRVASGSSQQLVQSLSNATNITTLSLSNVELSNVAATTTDFVPATVTNLTLHDCNISALGDGFTRDWSSLQYLDLSSNNLDEAYVGGDQLKTLNMSYNHLTAFPTAVLNASGLEALYIQGNKITDFNVTQTEFEQIQGLAAFTADKPAASATCADGAWEAAHNSTFCVLGAAAAAVPDSSRSSGSNGDDDSHGLGVLLYWLIAGAIVVFLLLLLLLWQRRRHRDERESSPVVSPEVVEPTTPKYNANAAFGDALNRDAAAVGAAGAVGPGAVVGARAGGAAGPYAGYGRPHGDSIDTEDAALVASLASNPTLAACRLDYGEVALGRCISRGGFGLVFVGSYRGRQVAVKKIRNERDVEREQVEQFVREISLISGLHHPRIVEFIGACWTSPAELSAVTELMERGDLRDVTRRFKRRGYRLTWEAHKTVIALHIAEALTYLHALSPTVIHRDLKAKNVLLNADMEAKLSDFGIARERSFYDGSEHMTVGIGTSFWIAPEVLLGRDYDERADIYSFGVVLSEIDTDDYPYWNAQHPPQGKVQENEILRLVARGAKRPAFSDDCPPNILELAARCLRAEPEERPSAAEIVLYLQQIVQDRGSNVSVTSMLRPGNSFDLNTRSTNGSSPTRTAPANTIVNLRSPGQPIPKQQTPVIASSAAAAYAAGKRANKRTTTTTTTSTAATQEIMVSPSGGVSRQVVHKKLPPKGKRTTTTTTTTRRVDQGSASGIAGYAASMAGRSSEGGGSARSMGTDSLASSRSHAGLPYTGPTSPNSLRANHAAALDNLQQQNYSSGEEEKKHEGPTVVGVDHRGQKWVVYEDVKEL